LFLVHNGQELALIKNPFTTEARRHGENPRRSCSVRKTGLNGIARGGIFEVVSSPEKGVEKFADPWWLDDYRDTNLRISFASFRFIFRGSRLAKLPQMTLKN
jgi:hypothetical protein